MGKRKVEYMPLLEFIQEGYLQEINRQVLHPAGLAIAIDCENSTISIWDYRSDTEGIIYGEDIISQDKINNVRQEQEKHKENRMKMLSYIVQPADWG